MKKLMFVLLMSLSICLKGQEKEYKASESFAVYGQIKKDLTFGLSDIEKFPTVNIDDVIITNHSGEPRGTASKLSGILIKEMLKSLELNESNSKLASEFYFVFIANDDYKVVYSWNEIFNSPTGDNIYLITSRDGQSLREMKERLLVLTPTDFRTGRRHIKGLAKIEVRRVD